MVDSDWLKTRDLKYLKAPRGDARIAGDGASVPVEWPAHTPRHDRPCEAWPDFCDGSTAPQPLLRGCPPLAADWDRRPLRGHAAWTPPVWDGSPIPAPGRGVQDCKTVSHLDCRPVAVLSLSQGYRVAAARTMQGNPTAQRVPLFFLTHRSRVSHNWQQTVIASSGARWGRAWWSSYRLPCLSTRVWPLMSLGHDPSLTKLSGLRTDTCSDPLGRHTFRAQAASCGDTQGALWQSLLRQPVVRAVGPSRRLPGRSEDTHRWYHRVRTSTTFRGWRSHMPPGRAPHPPTRPRTLRRRLAERALSVTSAPP